MKSRANFNKGLFVSILLAGVLWCGLVWAAEATGSSHAVYDTLLSRGITYLKTNYTRATWDDLMRWLNFFILAALIIKYARTPMINFLKGKKAETARYIQRMEDNKRQAEEKIREGQIQLKDSEKQLALIAERIIVEGRKRKAQMIEDAKLESRMLMEATRTRIDHQIRDTSRTIRVEMIEAAVAKAMVKLPQMITDEDHERMIGFWMEEARR